MEKITPNMERKGIRMESDRDEVALALKTWRLRKGYTQKQVGQLFGISRWTIIKIERAQPVTWETAYRVFAKLSFELQKEGKEEQENGGNR